MICLKKIKIQVYFICIKAYCIVVWEPSVAQGVIVSPTDYPRFVLNMILTIFPDESRSTQLRISKLKKCLFLKYIFILYNIPVGLRVLKIYRCGHQKIRLSKPYSTE